jgi:hypothetical protein
VVEEIFAQWCPAAHRIEVAAAEMNAASVVNSVGERVSFAELALVPNEIDEV